MKEILGVVALLFSMMFFILGILVKITLDFRNEMRVRMCAISNLLWEHEHTLAGRAFIPRDHPATQPPTDKVRTGNKARKVVGARKKVKPEQKRGTGRVFGSTIW